MNHPHESALPAKEKFHNAATGQDIDSGTAAEIGFSFATGKPVIAITASERRFRNLFVEGMFAYKVKTVQEIRPTISLVDSSGRNP